MRECGGCTECCYIIGVSTLDKGANEACPHAVEGVGCGIYETRPDACRTWDCGWLWELIPEHLKPSKIGAVLSMNYARSAANNRLPLLQISTRPEKPLNKELMAFGLQLTQRMVVQFIYGNLMEMWQDGKCVAKWDRSKQKFQSGMKDGKFTNIRFINLIPHSGE